MKFSLFLSLQYLRIPSTLCDHIDLMILYYTAALFWDSHIYMGNTHQGIYMLFIKVFRDTLLAIYIALLHIICGLESSLQSFFVLRQFKHNCDQS